MINIVAKSQTEYIDRKIKAYEQFSVLENEIEIMKNELTMLPNSDNLAPNNRKIKYVKKVLSVMSCIQIVICTIQIMITPLKAISYDKLKNKIINVETLISFAFLFLSYFLINIWNRDDSYQEERWRIYEATNSEYLKILEKVAVNIENK